MKSKTIVLIGLLISISFLSCTKNDQTFDDCNTENTPLIFNKIIKQSEWISGTDPAKTTTDKSFITEYIYNELNLLVKETFNPIENVNLYKYSCDNNLEEFNNTHYNRINKYNSKGELIYMEGHDGLYSYNLTYEGQSVLVRGTNQGVDVEIKIELNSDNLVRKLTRNNSYSIFDYDSNGNLIKAVDFDLNDEIKYEFKLDYDQNPNPFFGQLKSAYLSKFIYLFQYNSLYGIDGITYYIDNYGFPYFKNNLFQINQKIEDEEFETILDVKFTYDLHKYPKTFVTSTFGGIFKRFYTFTYH
ncbi:hypothetical protein [Polaribacter pacificus]|uniref:hypothetical protein n=1 Tax=Polaribacter pacificus TaxID=1775173 RepID=UPI001E62DF1D|nr:hypothetical protein [Polaribacter pacificus]